MDRQRWVVLGLWLGSLVATYLFVFYTDLFFFVQPNPPEGLRDPIIKLYRRVFDLYAPYLATMLAVGFSKKRKKASASPTITFVVAIGISLFWNGMVVWQMIQLTHFHNIDVRTLSEWLGEFAAGWAFVLTPIVALYFSLDGD